MSSSFNFPTSGDLKKAEPIQDSDPAKLSKILKENRFHPTEYQTLRTRLGRPPTKAELGVFSAMWSEHCSYKSSKVHLKKLPTTGPKVVVGPGENAGVVELKGDLCVAFKMESHNHPSYIEPYQGAATGVGGILRDVFCMGARPIANLNCLRFGEKSHAKTAHLLEHVVKGIGDYGNCIGVPTVGGNVSFDKTYNGNCLVNAMTVGLIRKDQIFKGYATGVGNLVVYVGSATGRDGIHGATMASDSFETDGSQERSTVQVGDPFTEKLLLEATLESLRRGLVIGLQDMGAAGLTSSSFEMASRAETGLYMDLDRVPVRAKSMTAYELLLSESQERMLMVIKPEHQAELFKILDRWQLAHAVIGCVTDSGRVQISYQGLLEVDVPVGPLTDDAPMYDRPRKGVEFADFCSENKKLAQLLKEWSVDNAVVALLQNSGSPEKIYRQYDHHIGRKTVYGPDYGGAAVLWVGSFEGQDYGHLGLAISTSCNERLCYIDPVRGGEESILKCSRMIAAAGGQPLAVTDCLNFGNPEDPHIMQQFSDAISGIGRACERLAIPVVSGNVSLYNETDGESIFPTPMIGMVGKLDDVRHSVPAVLREAAPLYLLYPKNIAPHWNGSLLAKVAGIKPSPTKFPDYDYAMEIEAMNWLRHAIGSGSVLGCREVSSGGIATTIAKFCLPAALSWDVDLSHLPFEEQAFSNDLLRYCGEVFGAYVIALTEAGHAEARTLADGLEHCAFSPIGHARLAQEGSQISYGEHHLPFKKAKEAFMTGVSV